MHRPLLLLRPLYYTVKTFGSKCPPPRTSLRYTNNNSLWKRLTNKVIFIWKKLRKSLALTGPLLRALRICLFVPIVTNCALRKVWVWMCSFDPDSNFRGKYFRHLCMFGWTEGLFAELQCSGQRNDSLYSVRCRCHWLVLVAGCFVPRLSALGCWLPVSFVAKCFRCRCPALILSYLYVRNPKQTIWIRCPMKKLEAMPPPTPQTCWKPYIGKTINLFPAPPPLPNVPPPNPPPPTAPPPIQPFVQNNLEINSDMKIALDRPPGHKKRVVINSWEIS